MAAHQASAGEEETAYEEQMAKLRALQAQQAERMAAARAPQVAAVTGLGVRAQTLEGGPALLEAQQARERAQAQAMVAARTPYGGKGGSPEAAILGGQIGIAAAPGIAGLEQEAAARQAAYLRGLGALGQGLTTEAEQMRLTEQEILRDMQARFLAAQRIAAGKKEQQAQKDAAFMGTLGTVGGTILGAAVGGPVGAGIGGKLGGSAAGGM